MFNTVNVLTPYLQQATTVPEISKWPHSSIPVCTFVFIYDINQRIYLFLEKYSFHGYAVHLNITKYISYNLLIISPSSQPQVFMRENVCFYKKCNKNQIFAWWTLLFKSTRILHDYHTVLQQFSTGLIICQGQRCTSWFAKSCNSNKTAFFFVQIQATKTDRIYSFCLLWIYC
jgi:hypothetical protein